MPQCPVCKERRASYYRVYKQALSRLLGHYPTLTDTTDEWTLLWEKPVTDRQSFNSEFGYNDNGVGFKFVKGTAPTIRFTKSGDLVYQPGAISPQLAPYSPFEDFLNVQANQELFLVPICQHCARLARERLEFEQYEFKPLQAQECPCCRYYTLTRVGDFQICPVCFWEDDGCFELDAVSGSNHITLRQGTENFLEFGACDLDAQPFVRPPAPQEHPRYHQS